MRQPCFADVLACQVVPFRIDLNGGQVTAGFLQAEPYPDRRKPLRFLIEVDFGEGGRYISATHIARSDSMEESVRCIEPALENRKQ